MDYFSSNFAQNVKNTTFPLDGGRRVRPDADLMSDQWTWRCWRMVRLHAVVVLINGGTADVHGDPADSLHQRGGRF